MTGIWDKNSAILRDAEDAILRLRTVAGNYLSFLFLFIQAFNIGCDEHSHDRRKCQTVNNKLLVAYNQTIIAKYTGNE